METATPSKLATDELVLWPLLTLYYTTAIEGDRRVWAHHRGEWCDGPPPEYVYQHAQFPLQLVENILRIDDGKSTRVMTGTSSYPESLVLGMVNPPTPKLRRFSLHDAILVAGQACERCMNALMWDYSTPRAGYSIDSDEYRDNRTRCLFCDESMRPILANPIASTVPHMP